MYQETILDNKLHLVTSAMPHTHSVSIGFFIGTGSRYESDEQAGISHFIEHMCFKGTRKRPTPREISEAIEGVGGIFNGGTDKELTLYWCKVARPHTALALDVLGDMLLNSRFDAQDIEKERQVIIEEIKMSVDTPSQRVGMLVDELLWCGHPMGRDIAGSEATVTAITREDMIDYMKDQYQPANIVVAVAGGIEHDEIAEMLSQTLGSRSSQPPPHGYQPYTEQSGERVRIETRDMEQVQVCLALHGLSLSHPKRFALSLLNTILGEGMSGRLFAEIRDKLGLAYSISSFVENFRDTGCMTVSVGVEPKNLKRAIGAVMEELHKLKEMPVPGAELAKAKEFTKGRLLLRMEDSKNVSAWLGAQQVLSGRILTLDDVISIIDAISVQELQQLAKELLISDELRLAVVGPVRQDEPLDDLLTL